VERSYLKDALRAILHTVLFHRVFANIKPRDMDILDLTIVSPLLSIRLAMNEA
jgi:hypothetical protein